MKSPTTPIRLPRIRPTIFLSLEVAVTVSEIVDCGPISSGFANGFVLDHHRDPIAYRINYVAGSAAQALFIVRELHRGPANGTNQHRQEFRARFHFALRCYG